MKHYPKGDFVGKLEDMTHDRLRSTYIQNEVTKRDAFQGCLFETYGPDHEKVQEVLKDDASAIREIRMDTILEEKGEIFVLRGYWAINRIGFLIRKEGVK